ncbi:MAG: hypothetical protein KDA29_00255 [Phycisphaerales bacterium]|nr:hypothetical protein [Phycisphaerales bacterium]
MELSEAQYEEWTLLSTKRWNPRIGRSRQVGVLIERIWLVLILLLIIGPILIGPLFLNIGTIPFGDFVGLGFVILISIPVVWFRWKRHQYKARVLKNDYFLCPWCRYALTDLEDTGLCPECGVTYERELCRLLYKAEFAPIQPDLRIVQDRERRGWRRAIMLRDGLIQPGAKRE